MTQTFDNSVNEAIFTSDKPMRGSTTCPFRFPFLFAHSNRGSLMTKGSLTVQPFDLPLSQQERIFSLGRPRIICSSFRSWYNRVIDC
jgi:hypothetical protein